MLYWAEPPPGKTPAIRWNKANKNKESGKLLNKLSAFNLI